MNLNMFLHVLLIYKISAYRNVMQVGLLSKFLVSSLVRRNEVHHLVKRFLKCISCVTFLLSCTAFVQFFINTVTVSPGRQSIYSL